METQETYAISTAQIHLADMPIHLADMPTLEHPAIADDTLKTPIPPMPEEVASGPGWQLYQYDTSYALVLHTLTESLTFALESAHLRFLGHDIHSQYRKLEEG